MAMAIKQDLSACFKSKQRAEQSTTGDRKQSVLKRVVDLTISGWADNIDQPEMLGLACLLEPTKLIYSPVVVLTFGM